MLPVIALLLLLPGCSLFDSLIPDVDTDYSKTFTVHITNSSGYTVSTLVDVTSSSDYNDFKDHIDGFTINKITWQISDYQAPDDMYFNGTVNAWDVDSTKSFHVADIRKVKLANVVSAGEQDNVDEISAGTDLIAGWLNSPGRFYFDAGYELTDSSGKPYMVEGKNYSFKMTLTYYVTVKTGSK